MVRQVFLLHLLKITNINRLTSHPYFPNYFAPKDIVLLESIRNYFNGVGSIYKAKGDSIKYRVASVKDLSIIIDHLINILC